VRSEEEVSFKTRAAPRERVKTVPVRREEVRVETNPPTEGRIVDVEDA
jgi:stress response protein YsnF